MAALADKIFLNLWTYPNLFKRDGKELCDLLVVCGDDVLIFSDKNVAWPEGDDFGLSWSRWYRRAIDESAAQINGAARYLREHPDNLFLDAACKEKFPLALPPLDRRRVHHIAVALGASEACADYYKEAIGYFPINPELKGTSHTDTTGEGIMRFAIGDVQPEGAFIHVFNEPGSKFSLANSTPSPTLPATSHVANALFARAVSYRLRASMTCSASICSPGGRTTTMIYAPRRRRMAGR